MQNPPEYFLQLLKSSDSIDLHTPVLPIKTYPFRQLRHTPWYDIWQFSE